MSECGFRYHYELLLGWGDVDVDKMKRKIIFFYEYKKWDIDVLLQWLVWYIYVTITNFILRNLNYNSTSIWTILFLCSSGGRKYLARTIVPWLRYVYLLGLNRPRNFMCYWNPLFLHTLVLHYLHIDTIMGHSFSSTDRTHESSSRAMQVGRS